MGGRGRGVAGLLAVLALLTAAPACPHELWLDRDGDVLVLRYGHTGSVHEGAGVLDYPVAHVRRVECFRPDGEPAAVVVDSTASPIRILGSCAVTCVLFSSGHWSQTPFGTKNLPKDEAKAPTRSWLSLEGVKRLDTWSSALAAPLTDDLELTPVEDPLVLARGEKVRLLVTLRGEPLADAVVAYDGRERGVSDRKGRINIRLKHGGLQFIQAGFTEPGDGLKCDEVVHTATLVFEIPDD